MTVLDTSSVISRVRRGVEVWENVTTIALIEYPPLRGYEKFQGTIYFASEDDQLLAATLQERLRRVGRPMSAADLLVAAICINRGEELVTRDEDFLALAEAEPSLRVRVEHER